MIKFGILAASFLISSILLTFLLSLAIIPTQCKFAKLGLPLDSQANLVLSFETVTQNFYNNVIMFLFFTFSVTVIYNAISS